jgi:hypothetical protein
VGWVGRGFCRAWGQLRESEAIRMVDCGEWEASFNALSRTVASAVKTKERGGRGTATVLSP